MRLDKQQKLKREREMYRGDSAHTFHKNYQRKSELRDLLREAVENTARQQVKDDDK